MFNPSDVNPKRCSTQAMLIPSDVNPKRCSTKAMFNQSDGDDDDEAE
jgi:hypothetical protein